MRNTLKLIVCFFIAGIMFVGCGNQQQDIIGVDTDDNYQTKAINTSGWYKIMSRWDTTKVIDADNTNGITDGSKVHLWTYCANQNQQWKFVAIGNGYYRIVSRANPDLALDADITPGPVGNGTSLQIWSYVGNENQMWQITGNSDYSLTIRSRSNTNYVIDADNTYANGIGLGSLPNGTKMQIWETCGTVNQLWYAFPVW